MNSLFSRKKSAPTPSLPEEVPSIPSPSVSETVFAPISPGKVGKAAREKGKDAKGYSVRETEKKRPIKTPRTASTAAAKRLSKSKKPDDADHPLNFHPDDPRRLSALSAMSGVSQQANGGNGENGDGVDAGDRMDMSPAPEQPQAPGAFPETATNGMNGEESAGQDEDGEDSEGEGEGGSVPIPPPHRSPPPQQPPKEEVPKVDPEACKAAGNKFYKAGQYGKAIDEYSKAVEADPKSATYLSNRTAAYMSAGQYGLALLDCQRADVLDPNNPKVLHRLAKVYVALGQPGEALATYDRINPPPSAKDRQPATQMLKHLTQAQQTLASSGSLALHALDQAQNQLPSNATPPRKWRLMRGEAHLLLSNPNSLGEAAQIAMGLLRNNSADPEALVLRGRALYGQGENPQALAHFRKALECDPDFRDAVKWLRLVQKLDRLKEEGNDFFKRGRYQQAIDVYTSALEVDAGNRGTNSKILNNRAMCFSKLKQWTKALEDCDKAIQMDATYTKARKTRAKALGEGGDWEAAVREYKAIAEANPEEAGIAKDIRNAELELKKSKRKDYYKSLGIEKDANDQQIKKAYRKLAVIHHPDKNPGDAEAEARFKDIQEAHETLIDPQKRERYDSGVDLMEPGEGMHSHGGGFGGGGMGGMGGQQIDPEVLFQMFGQGGGMGGGGRSRGGGGGFSPFG